MTYDQACAELEAADAELQSLRMVNVHSLDTAEKKLDWDVRYKLASDRWSLAYAAKCAAVSAAAAEIAAPPLTPPA